MSESGARPQDVGRAHRRRRGRSVETAEILDRYRAAMRAELADVLADVRPATGQLTTDGTVAKPALADRLKLWDLAIKLGRELGGDEDPGDDLDPGSTAAPTGRGTARAPKLTARERRDLDVR